MTDRDEYEQRLPGQQPRHYGWERFNEAQVRMQNDPMLRSRVHLIARTLGVTEGAEVADIACALHAIDIIEAAKVMEHVRRPLRLDPNGPTYHGGRF